MRYGWLLGLLLTLPAAASDFGARYPAGSIVDAAAAQTALKEADAEMADIARRASMRDAECYRRFLVNSCRDDVRREKELAEREVRRVRVEAGDLQRRIDAEQVAKQRAAREAAQALEDAQRPQNEQEGRAAAKAREADVQRGAPTVTEGGAPPPGEPVRSSAPQERLTAEQRAENLRKYQQKQAQAQKRAQEVEIERKENELRRAEKRKQVEQREAEREAIRKKAAESIQ
ncbi:MAG: hypothetical protein ACXW14_01605 [Burkholderiaceae bacterium]